MVSPPLLITILLPDFAITLLHSATCVLSRFQLDHWLLLSLARRALNLWGAGARNANAQQETLAQTDCATIRSACVDGRHRGAFEEAHDAITSANIAQREHPRAVVAVANRLTGTLLSQLAF